MKKLLLLFSSVLLSLMISNIAFGQEEEESDGYDYGFYNEKAKVKITDFMTGIQYGYKQTFGDFGKKYGSGSAYLAMFEWRLWQPFALGFKSGYMSWTTESETSHYGSDYDIIPLNLQFLYYFPATKNYLAYIGLETGLNLITFTEYVPESDPRIPDRIRRREYKSTSSKMGFAPILGFYTPLGEKFKMHISVKYNIIVLTEQENNEGEELQTIDPPDINYLGIDFGISLPF